MQQVFAVLGRRNQKRLLELRAEIKKIIADGGGHIADGQFGIFQQHLRVTQLIADHKLLGGAVHDMAAATVQVTLRNMQSRAELVHMNGLAQMRFQILKEPGNDVLLAGAVFGGKRGRVLQADQPDQQKMQQRAKLGIAAGPARPDILVAGHQGRGIRRGQDLRKVQNARETELL